jgi:PBSX family phage portal protein
VHVKEPDIKQDIYGIPPYYGGIQSVLLGEDATLFKRKYYINGSHMGYILVTQDADIDDDTAQLIEKKVKESKGPGNFRSMYLNIGKTNAREPVKIIPVGNFATTDEYQAVKGITKDEMLSMHRMQPGLSGIIPEKMTGFGDMQKLLEVYHEAEVTALQQSFLKINEVLGARVVQFREPRWVQSV